MKKILITASLITLCSACAASGIKYPERESEYERVMKQCPQGYERACQERYEKVFSSKRR